MHAGNLATWQPGNLATWQPGNLATWQPGNLATWHNLKANKHNLTTLVAVFPKTKNRYQIRL